MTDVPEDAVVVSWSEISTGRQCPLKHKLAYRERWSKPTTSPALVTGTAWHTLMEAYYRNEDVGVILQDLWDDNPEVADLVAWMFDGYLTHYTEEEWKVLKVEEPFLLPLDPDQRYWLKGRVDLSVDWRGHHWLTDHKSGKQLPSDKELALDDQFGLYAWAMRELGTPAFGLCWNAAKTYRTQKPQPLADRFRRVWLHRTDAELDVIHAEALATVRWLYEYEPGWRSPDTQTCRWRCDYTEACLLGRKEGDVRMREALHDLSFVIDLTRH